MSFQANLKHMPAFAFLMLAISTFAQAEDSWTHYTSGGSFVTASPSFSPEHGEIVFASPVSGHGDIYIADVAIGITRRLTNSNDFESSPYYLPGSKRIVFQREKVPHCHIWLLDLQTGAERQLTRGEVWDNIIDVAATGKHLLIARSTNQGPGRLAKLYLIETDSGNVKEVEGTISAVFTDQGTKLLSTWGDAWNLGKENFQGEREQPLEIGSVSDFCDAAKAVVFLRYENPPNPVSYDLFLFNLTANKSHSIGKGHSPRLFANSKVFYTVGYGEKTMVWEKGAQPRQIERPAGSDTGLNRSADGKFAAMFVSRRNSPERYYDIYLFDSETEKFKPISVLFPPAKEKR